jgi:hypothetical protein
MKALLICPHERPEVALLAERQPLALLPVCGRALIELWLEHLAGNGVREVTVLASDRPEQVRALLQAGRKWGVKAEVIPQHAELSIEEARSRYADLDDVAVIDRLPGQAETALESYKTWYNAVLQYSRRANGPTRIGLRELSPGVWVGLHARVDRKATLQAPCWIGDDVRIGADAKIGPNAVVESRCFVEAGAEVRDSVVAPDTFVGGWTEVVNSIACGSLLINWERGSHVNVPDQFLLGAVPLKPISFNPPVLVGRLAAGAAMVATLPLLLYVCLKCAWRGQPPLRQVNGVRFVTGLSGRRLERYSFYEFTNVNRWVRRWPQLLSIITGDFCWVGNRPLSASKANRLRNDFERLWLQAPIGLISLADVRGWMDFFSDEARAHSSFYAVQRNWKLDLQILSRAPLVFVVSAAERLWENELVPMPVRQWLRAEYPNMHRT